MNNPLDPTTKDAEKAAQGIAETIQRVIRRVPGNWGFTLLLYQFGEGGSATYISNGKREDMIKALEEFIDYAKKGKV